MTAITLFKKAQEDGLLHPPINNLDLLKIIFFFIDFIEFSEHVFWTGWLIVGKQIANSMEKVWLSVSAPPSGREELNFKIIIKMCF